MKRSKENNTNKRKGWRNVFNQEEYD